MMTGEDKPVEEVFPAVPARDNRREERVCVTYGRHVVMNKQVVSVIRELGIRRS